MFLPGDCHCLEQNSSSDPVSRLVEERPFYLKEKRNELQVLPFRGDTDMLKTVFLQVLERMILLPGGPIFLLFVGIVFWWAKGIWWPTVLAALLLLWAALPVTTEVLWSWMDIPEPFDPAKSKGREQAIVILGTHRYSRAPEYGGRDNLAGLGLERVRYGAWLQKRVHLPILVSGRGYRAPGERSEARIMQDILENEFGAQVEWLEEESHNTYENARYSATVLKQADIHHIFLVTHAYHMPRAQEAFERMGMKVTPASTVYFCTFGSEYAFLDWLPEQRAFHRNRLLIHEIVGRWWYRWWYD